MEVRHINRRGDIYYLHQKHTRTGKLKYFFSMKSEGILAESIPVGYEIYENPNAQVFLRRISPQIFTDEEVFIVRNAVKNFSKAQDFKIDIKNNQIIIFLPDQDFGSLRATFSDSMAYNDPKIDQALNKISTYSPMMRLIATDEINREFQVERRCFFGSKDSWIFLDSGNLKKLVKKYCPHLGQESFFELM